MRQKLLSFLVCWLLAGAAAAETPTVTIGAEDDAAPWSYADGSGYVNDLVRAAFEVVHWRVKFRVLPYPRCKAMTEKGELDACFSASKTPETQVGLQFPDTPVFVARNVLFAPADSPLAGCDSAAWGRMIEVGFVREYEYAQSVVDLQKSEKIRSVMTTSEVLLVRMLSLRRFDAAVITVDPVRRIELVARLAAVAPQFKAVCDFGGEPAYLAFSKKSATADAALAAFNQGMAILHKNGKIAQLQKQWSQRALAIEAAKKH